MDGLVAQENEGGVQSGLRTVGKRIEIAECAGIAATVLIVALVRSDEGVRGHVSGSEVAVQSMVAFEADGVTQAQRACAFLNALEVDEGVVLDGIEGDEVGLREWRIELWIDQREVGGAGEEAIAVVHAVRALGRQAFLIRFPTLACGS